MNDLPAPLVAADVDLRDFPYMPLDVVRLRDSDLMALASGEGFRAAVLLWCVAWHQSPAASLPDDDRLLARYAGFGRDLDAWAAVREEALRGFKLCADRRLYHPVIAEKANEAWVAKQARKARTSAATAARGGGSPPRRDDPAAPTPTVDVAAQRDPEVVDDDVTRDEQRDDERNVHQGKGEEGKGKGYCSLRSQDAGAGARDRQTAFEAWWQTVPHKVGKDDARKSFERVIREKRATLDELTAGMERYRATKPPDRQRCNPATWLNQGRWQDEPAAEIVSLNGHQHPRAGPDAMPLFGWPTGGVRSLMAGVLAVAEAHKEAS